MILNKKINLIATRQKHIIGGQTYYGTDGRKSQQTFNLNGQNIRIQSINVASKGSLQYNKSDISAGATITLTNIPTDYWSYVGLRSIAGGPGEENYIEDYKIELDVLYESNYTPVISGDDANLGAKAQDFDITYLVTDQESASVTVEIKVNDNLVFGPSMVTCGVQKTQNISISDYALGDHKIYIRATDADGASAIRTYTFSKTNTAPIISGNDGDLGAKNSAFSIIYQVWDDNGDTINVTVKLNGQILSTITNPAHKSDLSVDIDQEMIESFDVNQKNTIEISASDGRGAVAYRKFTFTRTNLPPIISGADTNLGDVISAFEYEYSMTDLEGDEIFYITYLDGKLLESQKTAESGKKYKTIISGLDFLKLNRGLHVFKIVATDSVGSKSERVITFSRSFNRLVMKLKTPIETDVAATKVLVTPGWEIAPGATGKILVCNNGFDSTPTWEDATDMALIEKAFVFQNKVKTSSKWGIDIRLEINRGNAQKDSYITGIGGAFE